MRGREIRAALRAGRRVYATAITAAAPCWPELLRAGGVDFAFIDSEHTPLGRETLAWMCRAYAAVGIPPVVRIPSPDPSEATKTLDGGAGGIIGPYVETAQQVTALTGAARLRPLKGRRLEAALQDASTLEPLLKEYLEARNQDTILIVNVESVPAVENLQEILSVPGLDAVLVGPHDLSCSLGIPEQYRHPRFDETVRTIIRQARSANVGVGIHNWSDIDQEIEWCRAGANLVMHASDAWFVGQQLKLDLDRIRAALSDRRHESGEKETSVI